MTSGERGLQAGFTLVEAVVVILVIGVIGAMGSMMIAKLAPGYVTAAQAEKALAGPQTALWRMRRDFEKMLVSGTSRDAACNLTIHTTAGDISYTFASQQIKRNNVLLLDGVTPTASCPYAWQAGSGTTPSRLDVDFRYASGSDGAVTFPVKVSLYSFVAVPDASAISPTCDLAAGGAAATVSGSSLTGTIDIAFGGTSGTLGAINDAIAAVTVPAHATGLVNVVTMTPEGKSTLRNVFRFLTLSANSGPQAGGTALTITGAGFTGATGVTFGGSAGTAFSVDNDTQISVTTPAHAAGVVDVVIQGITPACTLTGVFTYI